jgi:hypothetical protein
VKQAQTATRGVPTAGPASPASPARAARAGVSPSAGLTLIELLLVMGILALVFGIGLGLFTSLDLHNRTIAAELRNALRSANNWAVARSGPARVCIDAEHGALRVEGLAVVGTWHFESLPVEGAFGLDGSAYGCELDEDGFQGRAVRLGPGCRVEIPVEDDPGFGLADGFAIECALRPDGGHSGRVLRLGSACGLDATGGGSLRAWLVAERKDENGATQSGRVVIESPPDALPPGRWSRVAVRYDRRLFQVLVEGLVVASVEETARVWRLDGPLVLSDDRQPFHGSLDSLVVSAALAEQDIVLPKGARFAEGVPVEVAFAPGGGLDRARHTAPVEIALDFDDGRRRTVGVSLYGTVE